MTETDQSEVCRKKKQTPRGCSSGEKSSFILTICFLDCAHMAREKKKKCSCEKMTGEKKQCLFVVDNSYPNSGFVFFLLLKQNMFSLQCSMSNIILLLNNQTYYGHLCSCGSWCEHRLLSLMYLYTIIVTNFGFLYFSQQVSKASHLCLSAPLSFSFHPQSGRLFLCPVLLVVCSCKKQIVFPPTASLNSLAGGRLDWNDDFMQTFSLLSWTSPIFCFPPKQTMQLRWNLTYLYSYCILVKIL